MLLFLLTVTAIFSIGNHFKWLIASEGWQSSPESSWRKGPLSGYFNKEPFLLTFNQLQTEPVCLLERQVFSYKVCALFL